MKKTYKVGEIVLALREEYKEVEGLLDKLNKCIQVKSNYAKSYFTGELSSKKLCGGIDDPSHDKKVLLTVEKNYSGLLCKTQHLIKGWYSSFLYRAIFNAEKNEQGLYSLNYDDTLTWFDKNKYIPEIEIIDQETFSQLISKLLSSDLMQLEESAIATINGIIWVRFGETRSHTSQNVDILWKGIDDSFNYSAYDSNRTQLLQEALFLEIPVEELPKDLVKLLEKNEGLLVNDLTFEIADVLKAKQGSLQIADMDSGIVKLERKPKK